MADGGDPADAGPASERLVVLRLLEAGRITAAEAAELLRALGEGEPPPGPTGPRAADWVEQAAQGAAQRAQRAAQQGRRSAEFWARRADALAGRAAGQAARTAEQIGENVGRIFTNLPDWLEGAARVGWGNLGVGHHFEDVIEGELEGVDGPAGLDLEAWNGRVILRASEGSRVRLVLRKTVHAPSEEQARRLAAAISAEVMGRQVVVRPAPDIGVWPGGLSIEADLPEAALWGGVVRSGNGRIEALGLHVRGLRLETSNGRVTAIGGTLEDLTAVTSNGRIEVDGVCGHAVLRTSNGGISIALADGGTHLDVNASTSNGGIELILAGAMAMDVEANTSNGRIDATGLGPEAPVPSAPRYAGRASLHWRSPDWEQAATRCRLALQTSNGGIRFQAPQGR